jgi:hypothetical protein
MDLNYSGYVDIKDIADFANNLLEPAE